MSIVVPLLPLLFIGKGGYDGDGDITKPENVEEFKEYVLTCTEGRGVHFVMADGVRRLAIIPDFGYNY